MKNRSSGILWGIAFIVAGVGFAGDAFELWNFDLFFNGWWTLFLIVPSLISLFENGIRTSTLSLLGVGVILLLMEQNIINPVLVRKLLVPAVLIVIGVRMLFRNPWRFRRKKTMSSQDSGNFCDCWAVLSGREETFSGWLGGANMTAVLGSAHLNLQNAVIDHDIVVSVTTLMGGAELIVPQNVRVHVNVTPILGGVDNRANEVVGGDVPTVYVNGLCIMGGLDIK